ncbi:MAG: MBL fold metallo-hydrolase RNA specificity domain-containing protein [Tepidisphaeraceae bacterium]
MRKAKQLKSLGNYSIDLESANFSQRNAPKFAARAVRFVAIGRPMVEWDNGLYIPQGDLWLDSRRPRSVCFVSHAHSDHLGAHRRAIATQETSVLALRRIGADCTDVVKLGQRFDLSGAAQLTCQPAGHVLGSAMLHVETPDGSLLYTGDYKLRPGLTTPSAQLAPADFLLMESTYGNPFFRFPAREQVVEQLIELVVNALADGIQPIVLGYSLGKAQEIVRTLTDAGLPVTEHGAVANISDVYEQFGVGLGPRRRYAAADFHSRRALDLAERGVLVAPPQAARSPFSQRFERKLTIMMSGWALMKNARFRYGVDHALPLSDHADFDELIRTVELVNPKRVYTHHGFPEFVDHLKKRGWDARLAKPDPQLQLFD